MLRFVIFLVMASLAAADQRNPDGKDITYYLCTPLHPNGVVISYNDSRIDPDFSSKRRTFVIVHGFSESIKSHWMKDIKDGILEKTPANVIIMDWGILAAAPMYNLAAPNTDFAGKDLSLLLQDLVRRGGMRPKDVHLIGFSLGAQLVGVAGHNFKTSSVGSSPLDRITGLDPAAPLFDDVPPEKKLDKEDGSFVDVIHTNSGLAATGHLSVASALGHVDFFPNGGHDQRGCPRLIEDAFQNLKNFTPGNVDACSHSRAYQYFNVSLKRDDFVGYKCLGYSRYQKGSCTSTRRSNILGYSVNRRRTGEFYMDTLVDYPYVASQNKMDFVIETTTSGKLVLTNKVPGLKADHFQIFEGGRWSEVDAGETATAIVTSGGGGVTRMGIELEYVAREGSPETLLISSINSVDIKSGAKACVGRNLKLKSHVKVPVIATNGPC